MNLADALGSLVWLALIAVAFWFRSVPGLLAIIALQAREVVLELRATRAVLADRPDAPTVAPRFVHCPLSRES